MRNDCLVQGALGVGSVRLSLGKFGDRNAARGLGGELAQLLRNLLELLTHGGGFAFQLCLDTGVHHLAAFTLHRATALGQHLHQSAGTTAEVLHSHQFVVDGAVTACRQIRLVRHHRSIQRRQSGTQFVLCCVTCRLLLGECLQACLQATDLATGNVQSQGAQLCDECTVSTCGIGLTFEWLQLTANLAQQVLCSHEVCFGALQTTFGLLFSFAVL